MPYMVICKVCQHIKITSDAKAVEQSREHFSKCHSTLKWHWGRMHIVEITKELYEAYLLYRGESKFWIGLRRSLSKKPLEEPMELPPSCIPTLYRG